MQLAENGKTKCLFSSQSVSCTYCVLAYLIHLTIAAKRRWCYLHFTGENTEFRQVKENRFTITLLGFPGGTSGKEPACQCRRQETRVRSLGQEDPLEEGMATHSSILAWRIPMDRGAWQATVHRVTESGTTEVTYTCSLTYLCFSA